MALADIFTRNEGSASSRPTVARRYGEVPTIQGEGMVALQGLLEPENSDRRQP